MRRISIIATLVVCITIAPTSASATTHHWPLDAQRIEQALANLGLPVGPVDGVWDHETARATCAWRELTGRAVMTSWPIVPERPAVKATRTLTVPRYMRLGLNIDITCQVAYWIVRDYALHVHIETDTVTGETSTVVTPRPIRAVQRVMPVSTGMAGFDTVAGVHTVLWTVDRWWQSTIYPDGRMYRPMFFHDGQALHGSIKDSLVHTYPASHGCVRMLHADIDELWDAGFGPGDVVYLYGSWRS